MLQMGARTEWDEHTTGGTVLWTGVTRSLEAQSLERAMDEAKQGL